MRHLPLVAATLVACANISEPASPQPPTTTSTVTAMTAAGHIVTGPAPRKKNRLGMNGEGFFRNLTTWDIAWLQDLDTTLILRMPGGGDSKFAHAAPPDTGTKGWGLREEEFESYFEAYLPGPGEVFDETCDGELGASCPSSWCNKGEDKTREERAKLRDRYEQQETCDPATQLDGLMTCNYLEKLVLLDAQLDLEVVWVANVMSNTPESVAETVAAIDYLVDHGVKVSAIELGNESYFPVNLNWRFDCYEDRAVALMDAIRAAHPLIPISMGAANLEAGEEVPGTASILWNDALADFLVSADNSFTHDGLTRRGATAVSVHYYLTSLCVSHTTWGWKRMRRGRIARARSGLRQSLQAMLRRPCGLGSGATRSLAAVST